MSNYYVYSLFESWEGVDRLHQILTILFKTKTISNNIMITSIDAATKHIDSLCFTTFKPFNKTKSFHCKPFRSIVPKGGYSIGCSKGKR